MLLQFLRFLTTTALLLLLLILLQTSSALTMKLRSVQKILPRTTPHWVGDGFRVYPVFSQSAFTPELSPLLMFDYAEPKQFPAKLGPPLGVGTHPHRGFETVTLAFQGEVEHSDSRGNQGVIGPGDVQWMTAGRGILHDEFHSKAFTKNGGTFEMAQLWVNLPQTHKLTKPRYQELKASSIPVVNLPLGSTTDDDRLGTARIIAGQLGDVQGPAQTFSPVQLWDVTLPKKGVLVDLPFPTDQTCIVFARSGSVEIVQNSDDNNTCVALQPQQVALMNNEETADTVRVRVLSDHTSLLILGGQPLNEPIANMGPFVMNTKQELQQAVSDFRMGKF